jgi:hypothetical protein
MREDGVGKAGLIGVHTIVILNKDGWLWPCEEEGERRSQPHRRWSADKVFEAQHGKVGNSAEGILNHIRH